MRKVLVAAAALLAAVALGFGVSRLRQPAGPPNLVVIVVDTLRADHLPFHGYPVDTAPFLSSLASRGLVFTRATATSSWTAPSTASIFTSLYPFQHGVVTGFVATRRLQKEDPTITLNRIPDEIATLPEVLAEAGYRTFGVADNVNICAAEGFDAGFDRFANFNYESADRVNRQMVEWRDEILRGPEPYFTYVHYMDPHAPYHRREPWYRPPAAPELEDVAAYDSEIGYVDEKIRELFGLFGWEDDPGTVVVVTSDHGEEFREHGRVHHGQTLYGEVLDVPLLIYAPGRLEPGRSALRASGIDILPTLRALAGLPASDHDEGSDLLALATGDRGRRGMVFAHLARSREVMGLEHDLVLEAALLDRWKYIRDRHGADELYDLASDPGERRNRADELQERAARLREALGRFLLSCRSYDPEHEEVATDRELLEKLRSLGYVR